MSGTERARSGLAEALRRVDAASPEGRAFLEGYGLAHSTEAKGLDVERLARALEKVERDGLIGGLLGDDWGHDDHGHPVRNDWSTAALETARAVATEYTRLASEETRP